jgi:hypothetical protein
LFLPLRYERRHNALESYKPVLTKETNRRITASLDLKMKASFPASKEDPKAALSAWSLNGARFAGHSRDDTAQTLRWLQGLSQVHAELPDVLCLQDFRVSLVQYLRPLPHFCFVPMTNHMFFGEREPLGICIASRWPITHIDVHHSWGDGTLRDLEGVDERNERIKPNEVSDELVLRSHSRVAIACTVCCPGELAGLRIATHHGFWTRDGAVSEDQLTSTRSVATFLAEQARQYGGLVYLADYNPDKNGQVHDIYRRSGALDCLPSEITTTLAPDHPAAKFGIKSDCVMVWPDQNANYPYAVQEVALDASPGSDHLMLRSVITRSAGPHGKSAASSSFQCARN